MDEEKKINVMSVELAIQRELAYRKKVASLQSRSDVNFMKGLLPLKVPSSSPPECLNPSAGSFPGSSSISNTCPSLIPGSSHQVPSSGPRSLPLPYQVPSLEPSLGQGLSLFPNSSYEAPSLSPPECLHPSAGPWPGSSSISRTSPSLIPGSSRQVPPSSPSPRSLPPAYQVPSSGPWLRQGSSPISRPSRVPNPSYPVSSSNPSARPFGPSHFGTKRKATTSSLQCIPAQQPRPSYISYRIVDQVGNFFCEVCHVHCSGAQSLWQHLKGHKHKANLQQLRLSGNGGGGQLRLSGNGGGEQNQLPRCDLCQIGCMNADELKMHLRGQRHRAKLQELEHSRKNGEEKTSQRPWCQLCQIWCMNEDALEQHFKGQKHVMRLYAIQGKTGAHGEAAAIGKDLTCRK